MKLENAKQMAERLMEQHGLLGRPWRFNFNNRLRTTRGLCEHFSYKILLNPRWVLASSPAEVRNTILHEIAHAIVDRDWWKKPGRIWFFPGHGHDMVWYAKALELGMKPCRCAKCRRRWKETMIEIENAKES